MDRAVEERQVLEVGGVEADEPDRGFFNNEQRQSQLAEIVQLGGRSQKWKD